MYLLLYIKMGIMKKLMFLVITDAKKLKEQVKFILVMKCFHKYKSLRRKETHENEKNIVIVIGFCS